MFQGQTNIRPTANQLDQSTIKTGRENLKTFHDSYLTMATNKKPDTNATSNATAAKKSTPVGALNSKFSSVTANKQRPVEISLKPQPNVSTFLTKLYK
jgi:hypothetical protein